MYGFLSTHTCTHTNADTPLKKLNKCHLKKDKGGWGIGKNGQPFSVNCRWETVKKLGTQEFFICCSRLKYDLSYLGKSSKVFGNAGVR